MGKKGKRRRPQKHTREVRNMTLGRLCRTFCRGATNWIKSLSCSRRRVTLHRAKRKSLGARAAVRPSQPVQCPRLRKAVQPK